MKFQLKYNNKLEMKQDTHLLLFQKAFEHRKAYYFSTLCVISKHKKICDLDHIFLIFVLQQKNHLFQYALIFCCKFLTVFLFQANILQNINLNKRTKTKKGF